jgi:plasmid stabilization system protein ParE
VERSVTWTESAADEFDDAAAYRAQTSKVYASAFAREVRAASRSLRTMAERGRVVPELGEPTIREIFVRNHRLIYKVAEERIWILGFIAGPRDFSRAWRERARGEGA